MKKWPTTEKPEMLPDLITMLAMQFVEDNEGNEALFKFEGYQRLFNAVQREKSRVRRSQAKPMGKSMGRLIEWPVSL